MSVFKKNIFKYVSLSALLLSPVASISAPVVTAYAQEATIYSVEQYSQQDLNNTKGQTITIEGYITGSLNSATTYGGVKTNLALGQSTSATASQTVPIQLPNGTLRNQYNIVDFPNLVGKKVRITGTSERYFSRSGIKSTTSITVIEDTPTTEQPEVEQPTDNTPTPSSALPISQVRNSPQQQTYTVNGKIISVVNGWGGQGFYINDASGQGLYVYPKQSLGYQMGDVVELTGTLSAYNGELQLTNITQHSALSTAIQTTNTNTTIPNLDSANQSTLVTINQVTVGNISSDNYKTATFTVTDTNGNELAVRLDNRTGVNSDQLLTKINTGDIINITGILSTYQNKHQLKPFSLEHFDIVQKNEKPATTSAVKIGDIQGEGHISPLNQQNVTVNDVVVTAVDNSNRFYVADITPDANDKTSNGISVFKTNHNVNVGDKLTITGTVNEYVGNGYNDKNQTDLSITEIRANTIEKTGTALVPAPIILGVDKHVPSDVIDNDGMTSFDPNEDALDFWESLEGMIVAVDNAKILGPMKHKEVYVLPENTRSVLNKVGGVTIGENDYNPERIPLLFKKGAFTVKSGDSFIGRLSGPVSYSYTNYKIIVDDTTPPNIKDGQLKPETSTIVANDSKLTIASYNIENFSANKKTTSNEKVTRIASSFINNLNTPDIITLVEVQDNNGTDNDGTTDATLSAKRLIDEIVRLGGPKYNYVDIAPDNNQDGGAPGGNIRTGYLYNPQRVSLSNKPVGQIATWENDELKYSLSRLNPTDALWQNVRKPLIAEFEFNGEKVIVISTHLNSKRGDNGLFGKTQPVVFHSELKRRELATQLKNFVLEGLTANSNQNIVMLGDFNDFEFTQPLRTIEAAGMTNLVSLHDVADRFSYFYQGNHQTLDHLLISNNLLDRYTFDMVHVNSPFMTEHGRASDHDPVIVQLDLRSKTDDTNVDIPSVDNTDTPIDTPNVDNTDTSMDTPNIDNTDASVDTPNIDNTTTSVNTANDTINQPVHTINSVADQPKNNMAEIKSAKPLQLISVETKQATQKKQLPKTGQSYNLVIIGVVLMSLSMTLTIKKRRTH